jgi:hypothetical protein
MSGNLNNRLVGVTVNGDLDFGGFDAVLRVKDLVLNGTASLGLRSSMAFEGTQRLDGHATIAFVSGDSRYYGHLEMQAAGTLTLGANVLVRGGFGIIGGSQRFGEAMELINEGTIRADRSGRTLQVGDGTRLTRLTNAGTIEATNGGRLSESATRFTNTGTVAAVGGGAILSLSNLQPNAGIIQASDGGLVSVSGDFSNLAMGTVRLGIGDIGTASNGRLNITGSATLDGTFSVFTTNAFVPSVGQDYTLLSFASRTGTFATLRDENPADGVTFVELDASLNVTLSVVAG